MAVFNYKALFASSGTIAAERLGIDADDVTEVKELWTGENTSLDANGQLPYSVPAKDARVYRLSLRKSGAVDAVTAEKGEATIGLVRTGVSQYTVEASEDVASIAVYSIAGQLMLTGDSTLDLSQFARGLYLVKVTLLSGKASTMKVVNE